MFLLAVTQAWPSLSIRSSCRVSTQPSVACSRATDVVVLVDDDVFAGFGRPGLRHRPLPPAEHRLAAVALQGEVGATTSFRDRLEPDRLQVAAEDHRPALPADRRFVQVVEVGGEDVAGREAPRDLPGLDALDDRRVQRRRRDEAVRARGRVLADRRALVAFEGDAQPDEREQRDADHRHEPPRGARERRRRAPGRARKVISAASAHSPAAMK